MRILMVDDNTDNIEMMTIMLKSKNYKVASAGNGQKALKKLRSGKFDLIISDILMPVMDGFQLCRECKKDPKLRNVYFIFYTATYTNEKDEEFALALGAQKFIRKPQEPEVFLKLIKEVIETSGNGEITPIQHEEQDEKEILKLYSERLVTKLEKRNIELEREIASRKTTENKLKESEEKYHSIFEEAASLILSVSASGVIIDCNNRIQQLLGYSKEEVIEQSIQMIIHPDSHEKAKKSLEEVFKNGILYTREYKMIRKDGEVIFVNIHASVLKDKENKNVIASCIIDDITEHIIYEKKQLLTAKILTILNRSNEWHNLIYDILIEISEFSGIEAVGIRYKEGEDYPYFDTIGFPESFTRKENFLLARDKKGKILYDPDGKPFLECMCGNIISKRTDSSFVFFTKAGSFWTNSTTNLLATTTDEERQTHTRNHCNAAGYESVALIPLVSGNETIGLLQLNDKRKNRFTEEMIHFFEDIGTIIGVAFKRIESEKRIIDSEIQYRRLFECARDSILILDADTGQILDANPFLTENLGYSIADLLSKKIWEIRFFKNIVADQEKFVELQQKEYVCYSDLPFETVDGRMINVEFVSNVYSVDHHKVIQCNIRDITERKVAEKTFQALSLRQEAILAAVPDIIMEVNNDKVYTWANHAGLEFFGEDVIGREAKYYFEGKQNIYDQVHPIFTGNEDITYIESWQRRKDGQKRLLAWWCHVLKDENTGTIGVLSTARDVTEHKNAEEALRESEEKYRNVVERANDGICIIQDTKVKYANAHLAEMWGSPVEEVIDTSFTDYIYPDELAKVADNYRQRMAGEDVTPVYETILRNKKGLKINAELNAATTKYQGKLADLVIVRDITERKRMEESLQATKDHLDSLIKASPTIIYTCEVSGEYSATFISENVLSVFGYTPQEFLSYPGFWADHIYPEDKERVFSGLTDILNKGSHIHEYRFRVKDDSYRWVHDELKVIHDNDLNPVKMHGYITDITERMRAEEALREREQSYKTLADSGHALIWTSGTDKLCDYFNRPWLEFTGRTLEQEMGNGWAEGIHPVDRQHCLNTYSEAFDRRESFSLEYRLKRYDGEYRWIIDEGCPRFDSKGEFIGYIGHCLDITERKQAEEALDREQYLMYALMNNVPDSIYFKDRASRFIRIGKAQAKLFGLSDPSEAEGKTDFDFFTEEHARQAYNDEQEIIRTGQPMSKEEKETWADRPDTWASTSKLPLHDKEGNIIGTFGISMDITRLKNDELLLKEKNKEIEGRNKEYQQLNKKLLQINKKLKQAKEKVEESDKLKTAFLQNISHEIRTPLNGIIGFSDMITNPDLTPEKQEQYFKIIRNSGDQLISIMNDIIVIATIEAGQEETHEKETNINKFLQLIKSQNTLSAETKNLSFTVSSALTDNEAIVLADETKLIQILTNLVSNAIKFTTEGFIKVNCRLDGNFLKFAVEDTGIGIPPEMHEKIFGRFFQIDHSETRLYGGTGLGLSIVKSYVHFLNGEIHLDSIPGKGSTFYFTVPYVPITKGDRSAEVSVKSPDRDLSGKVILIAEDDDINYLYLEELLLDEKVKIIRVNNGKEAVEICKANVEIDLVLMDIKMPVLNGYEATKQILKFRKKLPVVAQTAYAFLDDKQNAIDSGCIDHISKPIEKDQLMVILNKYLK